jgi:ATP-binding cassette subfamily B (MDR/TAP) protein 1
MSQGNSSRTEWPTKEFGSISMTPKPGRDYENRRLDTIKNTTSETTPSWRCLFSFFERPHIPTAISAAVWSIAAGATQPVNAILYGEIFTEISRFGAGNLSAQQFLHNASIWCTALAIAAGGAWIMHGALLSSWMVFGELQAKSARTNIFQSMLEKEVQWYDLRDDGAGSLLVRIQTYVTLIWRF